MISVVATAVFLYIIYDILVSQPAAVSNPWRILAFFMSTPSNQTAISTTLEWVVPSPTPYHAYQMIPVQS